MTNYQIINDQSGNPAYAVIPYDEFIRKFASEDAPSSEEIRAIEQAKEDYDAAIPLEVLNKIEIDGMNSIKVYREFQNLNQSELAKKNRPQPSIYLSARIWPASGHRSSPSQHRSNTENRPGRFDCVRCDYAPGEQDESGIQWRWVSGFILTRLKPLFSGVRIVGGKGC